MDLSLVQAALADAVDGIAGLNVAPVLPDAIVVPLFVGAVDVEGEYNKTFRRDGSAGGNGLQEHLITSGVYVSRGGDDQAARALLAHYVSEGDSSSIKSAIEADRTLGGLVKTLIVERYRGAYRLYTIGGTDYLGATFDVRVWAT